MLVLEAVGLLCIMRAVNHMWVSSQWGALLFSAVNDSSVCDNLSVGFLCYCYIGLALIGHLFCHSHGVVFIIYNMKYSSCPIK